MLTVELALAGLGVGAIAALAAVGMITSYRATGVFNLSFGALAMIVAYLVWQQVRVWGWPLWAAVLLDVGVVAPALGLVLERFVFRGLHREGAGPARMLVASLGVFVLLVGVATLTWGTQARLDPPSIVPTGSVALPGDTSVARGTLVELGVVIAVAALVAGVTRYTRFGVRLRAVVDRRALAELAGVPADRVAAAGWAFGSMLAGLTGVLLAPHLRLDPYGLTLLVLETIGVAVVARLASLPVAILAALAIGVGQSELSRLELDSWGLIQALQANLFVVVMLVALLVLPRMIEVGGPDATRAATRIGTGHGESAPAGWWVPFVAVAAAPLALGAEHLRIAQQVPALAIVFVSLVMLTGYAGQISLGQAGFAGLGALFAGQLMSRHVPGLVALFLAALLVVPVGLLTGWPAIRRRGLTLALTTFAVAAVVSRFVFAQPRFTSDAVLDHPWPFEDERAFYAMELACLGLVLLVIRRLHVSRLGRMLVAVRDHERGAAAAGVDVSSAKVFVFAIGAGVAALGGALLGMGGRAFDAAAFDPVLGLVWFAAVVVFGVDSAAGAVLAAGLVVALDAATTAGMSTIVIGALAVLLSRMPGGVPATALRLAAGRPAAPAEPIPVRLTPLGRTLRARVRP
ncbi:ABC transporter permease subunit [Embleya scabrispora]|uniref:branched-chain amino acid ABC transporter permease n=1 Tax=Embleya scabrispora TaxID=159449 RepID=UPI0003729F27|nr:ABC transporter permease [Embleya scabrispora]MYS86508.1 ABC transporter permease [Streptomyces sp. SID5474]